MKKVTDCAVFKDSDMVIDQMDEAKNPDKDQIAEAVKQLQELTGIKVTRTMICKGVFAKPNHIFFIAKSKSGIESRYEIPLNLEKEFNEYEVIREVIKDFRNRLANVN